VARWSEVEAAAPELAARARAMFDCGKHKTMATCRADGAPRISGTELDFRAGDAWIGSMPGAVKANDLLRDPRVAIHSPSVDPGDDPSSWPGEAKLAGVACEVTDPAELGRWAGDGDAPEPGSMHLFRLDVHELVVTALNAAGDKLVVEWWRDGRDVQRVER
jgi:Pyridoxamine 5'-phosphate oxidase